MRTSLLAFLFSVGSASAQVDMPVFGKQQVINGYAKDLEGEVLSYFSVYPEHATTALLTRCTNGKRAIAWETAAVPVSERESIPYFYFSWIAAHNSTTSGGDRSFDLYINDQLALTFTTHHSTRPGSWSAAGTDSTKLVFEFNKMDRHGDAHGFAHLRVPAKYLNSGQPARFKIVGHAQDSPDWFMTFRYAFEQKVQIEAYPFLHKGGQWRSIWVSGMNFGSPKELTLRLGDLTKTRTLKPGHFSFETLIAEKDHAYDLPVSYTLGEGKQAMKGDTILHVVPVIHRDIYLIHHSHNDIGYSHLQSEVEVIQNNNIWKALELIDQTKDYPEGSRFVWNVESLWAVENFLGIASESDKQRFIAAVKSGSIALSANYANILTGLCTPEEMHWIVEYADSLRKWYDLPITMAMQTDIPGMSWSMADAYAAHGIHHLSQGPNYIPDLPDGGDRIGNTLREQGDKPYWWKTTTGRDSILVWTAGQGYGGWHGFTAGVIKERGTRKIAAYMNELAAKGYPYEMVQWRYNIVSDNGPVDSTLSTFVMDWNDVFDSPRLIIANAGTMMHQFEQKYGKQTPTWSGDFTPYWEDGAYSTAKREGEVRLLSARLTNLIEGARRLGKSINPNMLYRARRSIVMWHEHTWGAWCSISDPDAHFTTDQWRVKSLFADSAQWYVEEIENGFTPDSIPASSDSSRIESLVIKPSFMKEDVHLVTYRFDPDSAWEVTTRSLLRLRFNKKKDWFISSYADFPAPSRDKSSLHIALLFNIPNATVRIGIGDTCVTPESGRIPGSNNDFFCAQRWIDVSNDSMGVTIVCPQGALWEVGEMVDERKVNPGKGTNPEYYKAWKTEAKSSSTIYLYALNNYWHTNFKADQEGPITFDIYLRMHGPFKLEEARRFGLEMTRPLISWWK